MKRSSSQDRESEGFARRLADVSADWYWEHDADDRVTFLSPSIRDAIGVDPQSVIGMLRKDLRGTRPLNVGWEEYTATIAARKPYRDLEYRRTNDKGEHIYYTVSGVPLFDARGRFKGYRGVGRNITARRSAEFGSQRLGRMFATLSATSDATTRATSPGELYRQICEAAVQAGQFSLAAVLLAQGAAGHASIAAVSGHAAELMRALDISVDASLPEGRGLVGTAYRTGRPCVSNDFMADERTRPWHAQARKMEVAASAALPLVHGGRTIGVLLFYHGEQGAFDAEIVQLLERMSANVSFALDNFDREAERLRAEQALRESEARFRHLATQDVLTGLPNRGLFSQLLNLAIEAARRYGRKLAVLFIDLDGFKYVNDKFGHDTGDELLRQMSRRFKECLRASDVVARLGGDEFVVLLQEVRGPQDAAASARKILAATAQPLQVLGHECRVTASVGVCLYPADAADEQALMKNADLAMYRAKQAGKNNCQFYSDASRLATAR